MNPEMKTINYRGGMVAFELPSEWKDEYEAEGGGTFYQDKPNSGTLRLNVLSFAREEAKAPHQVVRDVFGADGYEMLPCGFAMRHGMKTGEEQGTQLHLHRWEVLIPLTPTSIRLVCFTHTLLASQEGTELAKHELGIVDSLVRTARFSIAPGALPKRPWWQFWK
jgi:hypothetical protein